MQQDDCYGVGVRGPLFDKAGGVFECSEFTPTPMERIVAEIIEKRDRANPVSIAELKRATSLDDRTVKEVVESLITFHKVRIGAARGKPNGYFLIRTIEDQEAAVKPYRSQIRTMLRRLEVLDGKSAVLELLGQLRTEF